MIYHFFALFPAELFHKLSKALEILTDAAARVGVKIFLKAQTFIALFIFL